MSNLHIFYTNDLHGEAEKLALIATIIKQCRRDYKETSLFLDAGDFLSGSYISNVSKGEVMVDIFNALKYDAITFGEAEFMWGAERAREVIKKLNFPVVISNIYEPNGHPFGGAKAYHLVNVAGARVGILGVIRPDLKQIVEEKGVLLKELTILPPEDILKKYLIVLRSEGADFSIVLSHNGLDKDKEIAKNVKGIGAIIGGHSHSRVDEPIVINDTLIVQAGSGGEQLGTLFVSLE